MEQGKVRLRSKIKIRGRLSVCLDLGDEPGGPRVHVRTGGKVDPRLEAKFLVEGSLDFSKAFSSPEGLGARDKNISSPSFLAPTVNCSRVSAAPTLEAPARADINQMSP